jgi:hypothetical protein
MFNAFPLVDKPLVIVAPFRSLHLSKVVEQNSRYFSFEDVVTRCNVIGDGIKPCIHFLRENDQSSKEVIEPNVNATENHSSLPGFDSTDKELTKVGEESRIECKETPETYEALYSETNTRRGQENNTKYERTEAYKPGLCGT